MKKLFALMVGFLVLGFAFATAPGAAWYVPVGHAPTIEAPAPQLARSTVLQALGPLHIVGQAHHQFLGLAAQEQRRALDLSRVFLRRHQLDTGRCAAIDLVLQAGARAIVEKAVLALAHLENFLQEVQGLAHGAHLALAVTPYITLLR